MKRQASSTCDADSSVTAHITKYACLGSGSEEAEGDESANTEQETQNLAGPPSEAQSTQATPPRSPTERHAPLNLDDKNTPLVPISKQLEDLAKEQSWVSSLTLDGNKYVFHFDANDSICRLASCELGKEAAVKLQMLISDGKSVWRVKPNVVSHLACQVQTNQRRVPTGDSRASAASSSSNAVRSDGHTICKTLDRMWRMLDHIQAALQEMMRKYVPQMLSSMQKNQLGLSVLCQKRAQEIKDRKRIRLMMLLLRPQLEGETLAVLGLGRLGLCFAVVLEQAGYKVIGMDVNGSIVADVNARRCTSSEPGLAEGLAKTANLTATTDMAVAVADARLIFILVPTPNSGGRDYYNHSILANVLFKLNCLRLENKHVVISATVIPGFIRNTARYLLRDCLNTTLSYNPAFVAQGDIMEGYRTGGWFKLVLVGCENDESGALLTEVYERVAPPQRRPHICRMSAESAEIAKLCSNCFRTTKISFCNMVADLADSTPGADKFEICAALAKDDSIGPIGMRPGYGYGGPCYPRDNQALASYCGLVGVDPCIPNATHSYNEFHHRQMASAALREGKEEYVFEDVCYKPKCAVAMIDESPKLIVAQKLVDAGKRVIIRDRVAVIHEVMKEFGSKFVYEILPDEGPVPRPPSPSSSAAQLSAECAQEGQAHMMGFGREDDSAAIASSATY